MNKLNDRSKNTNKKESDKIVYKDAFTPDACTKSAVHQVENELNFDQTIPLDSKTHYLKNYNHSSNDELSLKEHESESSFSKNSNDARENFETYIKDVDSKLKIIDNKIKENKNKIKKHDEKIKKEEECIKKIKEKYRERRLYKNKNNAAAKSDSDITEFICRSKNTFPFVKNNSNSDVLAL